MNKFPVETICHIFGYLDQCDLAQVSMTSRHYYSIVRRYFSEFPRYRNRSITIQSMDDDTIVISIERPGPLFANNRIVRHARTVIFDESNFSNLHAHLCPKFIEFDEVYFRAHNSKMYRHWGDLFVKHSHAFRKLSLLSVTFNTTPTMLEYTKMVTHLTNSPQRIQLTFHREFPRLDHNSLFGFSAFRHCKSVSIECTRMRRTPLGAISRRDYVNKINADIVEFLHDESPRSLSINPQFTPHEVYQLASSLQRNFCEANIPNPYTLQLCCFNGYDSKKLLNFSTAEQFIVEEAGMLGALLVKRRKLSL